MVIAGISIVRVLVLNFLGFCGMKVKIKWISFELKCLCFYIFGLVLVVVGWDCNVNIAGMKLLDGLITYIILTIVSHDLVILSRVLS